MSLIILAQCTSAPEWQKKNKELIKQYAFNVRQIPDLPKTKIVSNLEAGSVTSINALAAVNLYPGVNAKLYWGTGTLTAILEVFSPVRLDYLQKAGVSNIPSKNIDVNAEMTPNIEPGKVYDIYDLQYTELAKGAFSRLITGKNMQISFLSMQPNSVFERHIHPEEQTMFVLRGSCSEMLLDGEQPMKRGDVALIPGNMVYGARVSDLGCDVIDIFWPPRTDYAEKEKAAMAEYHTIIPEGAKPELLVDGTKSKLELIFAEGPKWMNGKVYFSNMGFDQQWAPHPDRSSIVELSPDGSMRNITEGKMRGCPKTNKKGAAFFISDFLGL